MFEKCNNETISPQGSCHSSENITEFLRQRYIIVYQNQIRFAAAEYDSERIVPEGKLVWYQIESQKKSIITHKVQISNLSLQDLRYMHVGPLTELETTIFNIKPHLTRPYERLDDIH